MTKEVHLKKFHSILTAHSACKEQRALEIMQYILTFVGVCGELTIVDLDKEALDYCKLTLGYPSAVVGMCIQLSSDDFERLRTFAGDHLKRLPENIETVEELCLLLHQKTSISSRDVVLLSQWLEGIDRLDLAQRLDGYSRTGRYEDPLITSSLGDGTFPQQPVQATSK